MLRPFAHVASVCFRLTVQKSANLLHFCRHRFNMAKFFQIWSTVSQSETEKYFERIIIEIMRSSFTVPVMNIS